MRINKFLEFTIKVRFIQLKECYVDLILTEI